MQPTAAGNMSDTHRLLLAVEARARTGGLNAGLTVDEGNAGHVIGGAAADIQRPEAAGAEPPEHAIVEGGRGPIARCGADLGVACSLGGGFPLG